MHFIPSMDVMNQKSWRMTRMRGKIAKQYKNYGELLYAEGVTMRQNHLKAVSDRLKQVEKWELEEVTLKPKIRSADSCHPADYKIWVFVHLSSVLPSALTPFEILGETSRTKSLHIFSRNDNRPFFSGLGHKGIRSLLMFISKCISIPHLPFYS